MRWLAATLLALLALAYALIVFAAPSAEVRPAPDERGLGGLSLLVEAMRAKGYRVAFDPSSRPRLEKGDVAIAPVKVGEYAPFPKRALAPVSKFVQGGGKALFLEVPPQLAPITAPVAASDLLGHSAKVSSTPVDNSEDLLEDEVAGTGLWWNDADRLARLSSVGKGRQAVLYAGALATNRFLGCADNARVVLSTLDAVARSGDRLVFVAGGYGENEEVGPIEAIGPWAVGALWQSLAVLAAFGLARGIRFGLPTPDPRVRQGSRELLDVLASHYRRGRRTEAPLLAAAKARPDDLDLQAYAARINVPEADARRALMESEARPRPKKASPSPHS